MSVVLLTTTAVFADVPARESKPASEKTPSAKAPEAATPSEAEQITHLERTITADEKQLAALNAELKNPQSELEKARAAFAEIDQKLIAEKEDLAKRKEAGETVGLPRLEEAVGETEKAWKLARERLDLALQVHRTLQEQVTAIEAHLTQTRQALDKLLGTAKPPAAAAKAAPSPAPVTEAASSQAAASPAPAPQADAAMPMPVTPVGVPAVAPPAPAATAGPATGSQATVSPVANGSNEKTNKEIAKAEQLALEKQAAAEKAMAEAESLSERLASLDKYIESQRELLEQVRKKVELATRTRAANEETYDKLSDDIGFEERQAARTKLEESSAEVIAAQTAVTAVLERLQGLQSDRTALEREQLAATEAAKARQVESLRAQENVVRLKNPFALHNLLQWLIDHGPPLTLIIVAMFALRLIIKLAMKRVVDVMMQRGFRGTYEESEDRAKTLVGVFQNAASTTVIAGGMLMIFEEVGVAVAPLMGGAAVIGLAVAFGAQNLIRDYFYGFVILLENQYKINDVLRIGDVSGQVERITLRMTVLRDLEGCVHFIPNGKIECVTNMTHGWSRALFEIQVAYKEDTDHVVDVLLGIAKSLRSEPQFSRIILEDAEMLGVDAFGDSSVTIKFVMKTRPLKQWQVKREMLRRIKKKFDAIGIEIPFPQRVVHHRGEAMSRDVHDHGATLDGDQRAA